MTTDNLNDSDINFVLENFKSIKYHKKNVNCLEDVLQNIGASESNDLQKELFKLAYDNTNLDKNILELKLREHMKTLEKKKIDIIDSIIANVYFQTQSAITLYCTERKEDIFKDLIRSIVKNRTSQVSTVSNSIRYDILPIEYKIDDYGPWSYDPLFGQLKIYIFLLDGSSFPSQWKLAKEPNIEVQFILSEPEKFDETYTYESLEEFLKVELSQPDIMEPLNCLYIKTIDDLKRLNADNWSFLAQRIPSHVDRLRGALNRLSIQRNMNQSYTLKSISAEDRHNWHRMKLSLYYYANNDYKYFGLIDESALQKGFEEQESKKSFNIGETLDVIKNSLKVFTISERVDKFRNRSHGMLFYGPPGTGKTDLTKIIMDKFGLYSIVPPLSASEVNRSLVGQTEKLLSQIWDRAKICPHILCCIAIDEVDALAPKRTNETTGHKIDALSLLLALIGGIKDVPNVYVIASTNRLNKIDEAFCRRLQEKYYIGKLTNEQRIELLKQIENVLPKNVSINFNNLSYLLKILTIDFSGHALASFRSQILNYFYLNKNANSISDGHLIKIATKVANDFQVKLGRYCIPELINSNIQNINNLWSSIEEKYHDCSGRVLIDLQEDGYLIEFELKNNNKPVEISIKRYNIRFVSDIVPLILDFSIKNQVDNIQLIDNDVLINAGAFNEGSISELVSEKMDESEKFNRSVLIFDVDGLVGVSESQSGSSENKSYSVQNQRLWQTILNAFKRSYNNDKNSNSKKWTILVSGSKFLIEQFKSLAKFPLTKEESKQLEDKTTEKECLNCSNKYLEAENNFESCAYHPGALVNITAKVYSITKEDLFKLMRKKNNPDELEKYAKNFYYMCCISRFNEAGCKRNWHSDTHRRLYTCQPGCTQQ